MYITRYILFEPIRRFRSRVRITITSGKAQDKIQHQIPRVQKGSEAESSTSQAKNQNKPRQYKKDSFVPTIASKADLGNTLERFFNTLKQVLTAVHKSRKARSTATLYVGNIELNATEDDLRESLEDCLGYRIAIEKITIPRVNGKSMYGFIKLF
jgi:hypothetical protein